MPMKTRMINMTRNFSTGVTVQFIDKPSRPEIEAWIKENIDLTGYKNPIQAMGPVMKHFGKLADGNLVKQILQK